jgi:oligopeptidase B
MPPRQSMLAQHLLVAAGLIVAVPADGLAQQPAPPVAKIIPKVDTLLGQERVDPYFWLRDDTRSAPEVIGHLEAENRYTATVMRHTEPLQRRLFTEMVGRMKETDLSVPELIDGAWYYTRTVKGKQYPIFCRRRGSVKAPEEVLLDENQVAGKRAYSRVGLRRVSPDGNLLAYTWDTTGGEWYTLILKDLRSERLLADRADSVNYSVEWAGDNRRLFYGRSDAAHRSNRVFRHEIGAAGPDTVVFEEPDQLFNVDLRKSKDRAYLFITAESFTSSDTRYLRADQPASEWRVLLPRAKDMLYSVEHHAGDFLIRTNEGAINFKLVRAPVTDPSRANWTEVVPGRDSILLEGLDVFRSFAALYERGNGAHRIRSGSIHLHLLHHATLGL